MIIAAIVVLIAAATGTTFALSSSRASGHPQAKSTTAVPTTPAHTVTVTASGSAQPLDFSAIYAKEQSGVVRIETVSCTESGIGTGFLLSPTLVATVNHVIDQAAVVSLVDGNQRTTGTVIGTDPANDLALVRADRPLTGYHFTFADTPPQIGDQVAAIGFPIGDPITLTHGDVSGLNRDITVNSVNLTGMIETDTAINPGNSGGPLLDQQGKVVGLIDALRENANGIGYAVAAAQASTDDQQWEQTPQPVAPANCSNPLGPSQAPAQTVTPPVGSLASSQANGIAAAFSTYFNGIDSGNYSAAYDALSPRLRSGFTEADFASGDSTSYDSGFTVLAATSDTATSATIDLAFTSIQTAAKGPNGDTCDNWTLIYTLVEYPDGTWYIDRTQPYNGVSHTAC